MERGGIIEYKVLAVSLALSCSLWPIDMKQTYQPRSDQRPYQKPSDNRTVFHLSGGKVCNMYFGGRANGPKKKLEENFGRIISSFIIRYIYLYLI
jgi:hypothetical protein